MRFATKALRVGQTPQGPHLPVIAPIYQTATFAWEDLETTPRFDYSRCDNPSRAVLEEVLASLENGKHCLCTASGMSAIAAALSLLKSGDHVLMAGDIYGGTHRIVCGLLPKQGIENSTFDATRPESLARAAKPNSKMVIFETPTNPTLRVMDIAAIAREAKKLGLISVMDNTFASPCLQNPLDLGCDIVVHATTKYIGGHSDLIGGALITNDKAIKDHAFDWAKTVGVAPSPFDCWLALRGVKTLSIRMERHCENALAVARFLDKHPAVAKTHYPGLESHPDHALAKRQMAAFGGMVSFEVAGTAEDAKRVAERAKVFLLAESLGGVESLIGYPPLMSHAAMTEEQRIERGIPATMIRLSIGIEDKQDLCEDLGEALAHVKPRAVATA
jgi:cystathionine beta-lyase/cystathionine gamma-synthase